MNFETIANASANVSSISANEQVWHERFGHANYKVIRKLANGSAVEGMQIDMLNTNKEDNQFCEACIFGKHCRKMFNDSNTRADKPAALIHFDICGPMSIESFGGNKFMAIFVDDYTGMVFVYTMKSKADIVDHMKDVIANANANGHRIKRVRSDNAKEFIGKDMKMLLRERSILHELSTAYCPEQNGRVERQNRTIVEMARTLLAGAELPQGLWGEAVHTAAHIRNLIPLERLNGKTPMELWTGKKPNVSYLRIIGSKAYTLINGKRSKFEKKSQELVLIGYAPKQKVYRVWQHGTRKVIVSRDVIIVEPKPKQQAVIVTTDNDQDELDDFENNVKNQSRSSTPKDDEAIKSTDNITTKETKTDCIANRTRSKAASNIVTTASAFLADIVIPDTVSEAKSGAYKDQWESSMKMEYDSLIQNSTWTLVNPPEDRKPVKNKWIFRLKTKPDGSIDRFKARLVAKGCSQKAGVDYLETFSPVAKFDSIRTLLSIAATKDYEIYQLDVKTAFLHGDLNETIYMEQPEGFDDGSGKVCKLNKSIYGLKQASRQWYAKFDEFMQRFGLKSSDADPCVYTDTQLFVALYVDDGLVIGDSKSKIKKLLEAMRHNFEITSSIATCYLGIQIIRDRKLKTIKLSQATYTKFILKKFNMSDCNGVMIPADPGVILRRNLDNNGNIGPITQAPFQQLIGSLMYLSTGTRPDITHTVNSLSKFIKGPSDEHWTAAKQVLKYLKSTINLGIVYNGINSRTN